MLNVFLTGVVAFFITFLAIPIIIRVAREKKLYDEPDARKLHTRSIASLGGIGIFSGFILATLLFIPAGAQMQLQYLAAAAIVIFLLGFKDDIVVLSPIKKFIGQLMAAAILVHLAGIRIDSMHGLFGMGALPEAFSILISYATIIVIINAFNLIDGVDGLAGTLGLLTTSVFGCYFFLAHQPAFALLAFAMAGSLLAFLIFNHNPAKIFMGDSGSLLLGLVNAILVIKFLSVADGTVTGYPVESSVAVGFSVLMLPLADTLRVFSIRILHGRSPFSPDRNHIHHLLLDRGLNHKYVTFCCLLANIFFIALAYSCRSLGPTYGLFMLVAVALAMLGIVLYLKKPVPKRVRTKRFEHAAMEGATFQPSPRVSHTTEVAISEN